MYTVQLLSLCSQRRHAESPEHSWIANLNSTISNILYKQSFECFQELQYQGKPGQAAHQLVEWQVFSIYMYLRCIVVCQDCLPSRLDLTKLVQFLILVSPSQYKRNLQKCDHLFNMVMNIYIYTLQKQLGYFNHIFRLSQLHQCDRGMLPNWFEKVKLLLYLHQFQKTYLTMHSWHFYHKPRNQGTQGMKMCKIKTTTHLIRNADL